MRASAMGLWVAVAALGCAPPEEQPVAGGGSGPMRGAPASTLAERTSELSGGTLTLSAAGDTAVVSDPDRDQVVVVNLETGAIKGRAILARRTRPGRATVDGEGNFAIALRGTGELLRLSARTGATLSRVAVCGEPVDVAWRAADEALVVSCATGELVTIPRAGSPVVTARPAADLRDVIVTPDRTWVTTFRSAEVIPVGADGGAGPAVRPPSYPIGASRFVPTVAWRARPLPDRGLVIAHQRSVEGDIAAIQSPDAGPVPAYYTNFCSAAVVRSAVTVLDSEGRVRTSFELPGALPVDLAVSPDGTRAAVVLAGSRSLANVSLATPASVSTGCAFGPVGIPTGYEPIAVAWRPDGALVVQSHSPPELVIYPPNTQGQERRIPLHQPGEEDPAYALFHTAVGGLACASCHPEGRDDGHTWTFTQGRVRTQSLAGGLSMTAPYHWNGQLTDLAALMAETFGRRMGGTVPEPAAIDQLEAWLDGIPPPGRFEPEDSEAVARGAKLFAGAAGCTGCHGGSRLTNAATLDVGTGGPFQVPSLQGLRSRGPWMHDGCAKTLADRFEPGCGGGRHGSTSALEPGQVADLVTYLESL